MNLFYDEGCIMFLAVLAVTQLVMGPTPLTLNQLSLTQPHTQYGMSVRAILLSSYLYLCVLSSLFL